MPEPPPPEPAHSHGEPAIVFDYTITADDLVQFWSFCEFHRPGALWLRQRTRRSALRFAAAAVLIAFLLGANLAAPGALPHLLYRAGLWPPWVRHAWPVGIAVLTVGGGVLALAGLGNALIVFTAPGEGKFMRTLRRRARTTLDESPPSPFRIVVNAGGVLQPGGRCSIPWRQYAAIHDTPTLIVSVTRDGRSGFVPKRALGSGQERDEKVRRIMEWARQAGGGQEAAADALGTCGSCGYDLRGTESPVCPECGGPIEPDLWLLEKLDKQIEVKSAIATATATAPHPPTPS